VLSSLEERLAHHESLIGIADATDSAVEHFGAQFSPPLPTLLERLAAELGADYAVEHLSPYLPLWSVV